MYFSFSPEQLSYGKQMPYLFLEGPNIWIVVHFRESHMRTQLRWSFATFSFASGISFAATFMTENDLLHLNMMFSQFRDSILSECMGNENWMKTNFSSRFFISLDPKNQINMFP